MEEGEPFLKKATDEEIRNYVMSSFCRFFKDFFRFIFRNPFAPRACGGLQYEIFGQGKEKKKRRGSNNDYGCYSSYHF